MKLSLRINRHTTASELIHLGAFVTALALNRGAKVFAAPIDEAELDEPEHVAATPEQEAAIDAIANYGTPPKRRRRTKDEIAAAEAEAQASNEAALKAIDTDPHQTIVEEAAEKATGTPGNDQPAPTPTAPETTTGAAQAPATEAPSERQAVTPATLNLKATAVAKKIGPDKIKAKINELGGKLISTLSPEALVEFDAWLDAQ